MRFRVALAAILLTLSLVAPAIAVNRVQWLNSEQPPSQWLNVEDKDAYVGIGQLMWDIVGRSNTSGFFTNAQLIPNTGMYVTVAPINTNQYASLYQTGVTDLNPYGSGSGQLPADANVIFHQALTSGNANSVGPLVAPTVSGDNVKDLIECQVKINDTTQQTINFVSNTNVASSGTAYRDRADQWYCQAVLGTQATAGSEVAPSVDSGWVAVGTVDIPYGTSTVTAGMITTNPNWNGFLPAGSATTFVDLTTAGQNITATKNWNALQNFAGAIEFTNSTLTLPGSMPSIAGDYQASPGMLFNVAASSQGYRFYVNNVLKAQIDNGGYYWAGSSNFGSTSMNLNGTATINGGTFDGTTLTSGISNLFLNSKSGSGGVVAVHYGDSNSTPFKVFDGGTVNYSQLTATALQFNGVSTSAYTNTDATVYGNLTMPNQAAGQCAQFDGSHHLVAAGGACGLTSGTLSSVTSTNSNLLATTSSGAVTLDFLHAPQFNSTFIKTPDAATGYNVYVSTSTGTETKQNSSPIAIGTNWTEPTSGLVSGSALPTTDKAGFYQTPGTAVLGSSAAGTLAATTYYVKITYVNNSGESVFSSPESSLAVAANNVLTVNSPSAYSPAASVADLIFGTAQNEALTSSGSTFTFQAYNAGVAPTVVANGGFQSGSSYYYPSYATVNGNITATGGQIYATGATVPVTSGTEAEFAADGSGYGNFLASGNRFLFRTGAGTTFFTLDSSAGLTANTSLPFNTGSSVYGATSATVNGVVTAGAYNAYAYELGSGTSSGKTAIGAGSGTSVSGVSASELFIINAGVNNQLAMDTSGNVGISGNLQTGSSIYGATAAAVNGAVTATSFTATNTAGYGFGTAGGSAPGLQADANGNIYLNAASSKYISLDHTSGNLTVFGGGGVSVGSSSYGATSMSVNGQGTFVSPNGGTTGAVIIKDAPTNPNAAYLQFVNNADSAQYAFIRGLSAGGLDFNGDATVNSSGLAVNGFVTATTSLTVGQGAAVPGIIGLTGAGSNHVYLGLAGTATGGDVSIFANGNGSTSTATFKSTGEFDATGVIHSHSSGADLVMSGDSSGQTYLESANSADNASAVMNLTGLNAAQGSTLNLNFAALNFSGASASTCAGFDASKNFVSSSNCVHSVAVTGPITNSGTALDPNFGCTTCVVGVGATGPIASSGGTSPTISCSTCLTTAGGQSVGGTETFNAVSVVGNDLFTLNAGVAGVPAAQSAAGIYWNKSSTDGEVDLYTLYNSATSTTKGISFHGYYNGADTELGYITRAGVFYGTGFVNTSQRKYKRDITPLPKRDWIDLLRKADWKCFRYKAGDQRIHCGFIADDTPDFLSLDHTGFDMEAVGTAESQAILQQQAEIDKLEHEVASLNARLAAQTNTPHHGHSIFWYLVHPWVGVGE